MSTFENITAYNPLKVSWKVGRLDLSHFTLFFQAADITGGVYLKIPQTLALLQYLLVSK